MGGVVGEMVNKAISAFNSVEVEVEAELGKNSLGMSANSQPPSPKERPTAYSFNCFSQPPYPHSEFKSPALWACLLPVPPPPKRLISKFVRIQFLDQ